ncbi:uncharacterized protein LOC129573906 [Sitodiplosis mosellana]|uniref:uncharacterized protein LOC129573906 n=1 Tax=Sitodiplosis mosellana TaxID=263140 RepID=UPI002444EF83|nr:uncharacterized protein LOC129573906 [Sitodiplosis mosellana]
MRVFVLLTIVVLASVSHVAETRPKEHSRQTDIVSDSQTEKTKYVGCVFPYQYVNPYYHPRTARSCANLILDLTHILMPNPDDYKVDCDCIPGFVSNYQGYCIDEIQCNLWEAFGTLVDEGAVDSNADNLAPAEQEEPNKLATENGSQKRVKSLQFYRKNYPEIPNQPQDFDWNVGKLQDINSNGVEETQLIDNGESTEKDSDDEDEDGCCDEENGCCECDDEISPENNDEDNTEKYQPKIQTH